MLREMGVRSWFREAGGDMHGVPAAHAAAAAAAAAAVAIVAAPPAGGVQQRSEAEWLIVDGPFEGADDGTRAAIEAEQEKLLDNMLRAIGVSRDAVAPHGRACHIRLNGLGDGEIGLVHERVRPRCALVLGRAAAIAMLGADEPVGRLRGRVHTRRGMPVVVTFSLAYLLRNPSEKAKAWADLCLAVGALAVPDSAAA